MKNKITKKLGKASSILLMIFGALILAIAISTTLLNSQTPSYTLESSTDKKEWYPAVIEADGEVSPKLRYYRVIKTTDGEIVHTRPLHILPNLEKEKICLLVNAKVGDVLTIHYLSELRSIKVLDNDPTIGRIRYSEFKDRYKFNDNITISYRKMLMILSLPIDYTNYCN